MLVDHLNALAMQIVAEIAANRKPDGTLESDSVADVCARAACDFRMSLDVASNFVNCGEVVAVESPQSAADRLLCA